MGKYLKLRTNTVKLIYTDHLNSVSIIYSVTGATRVTILVRALDFHVVPVLMVTGCVQTAGKRGPNPIILLICDSDLFFFFS